MEQIIIEAAIKSFVQQLVKESFAWTGKITNETKRLFDTSLQEYFIRQQVRHSSLKTILNGNVPVYLYDIYFPLNLRRNINYVETSKIANLFIDNNFVTIIGGAGSGKSTLIKHLFINSIVEQYGIPILIELRYLNDYNGTIEDYISEIIFENQLSQSLDLLKGLLKQGKIIFFLDGFDELNNDLEGTIIKQLTSFLNKYGDNKYILTSRPYTSVEFLPLFHNYQIETLNKDQVKQFIKLQLNNENELSQKIIESVENTDQSYITSFLSNPLLLSLYILTFQSNPDIPHKKYIFYRRVVQALFAEHDSKSKLGYIRQRKSKLNQERFEEVLKRFSFLAFFERKYTFDIDYVLKILDIIKSKSKNSEFSPQFFIEDLKLGVALWIEESNKIQFAHKSLQEYFAALFVADFNIDQKATIYSKIIDTLSSINEFSNFLSLCQEMDEISYSKSFLLPALDKIISSLSQNNDEELITNIVNESYSSIGVSDHSLTPWHYSGKSDPLKQIREIKPLFEELNTFLLKRMNYIAQENNIQTEGWVQGGYEQIYTDFEQMYYLSLTPLPENIMIHLKEQGIIELVRKVEENLVNLRRSIEETVKDAEKANDELIDMI
jgi:energy-coupling factor transporter ATP-binding protein EcfA2